MESRGVRETSDGREFWRNAAEVGRSVSSICQKPTIKAQNKSHRKFLHLRYSWLACNARAYHLLINLLFHLLETNELDLIEAIRTRRSIRRFKQTNIPDNLIHSLINSARHAPSGHNTQPLGSNKSLSLMEKCEYSEKRLFFRNLF